MCVDGSLLVHDMSAAAGTILRRPNLSIIFAAYGFVFNCTNALEVEIHAIMQGMTLTI